MRLRFRTVGQSMPRPRVGQTLYDEPTDEPRGLHITALKSTRPHIFRNHLLFGSEGRAYMASSCPTIYHKHTVRHFLESFSPEPLRQPSPS